MSGYKRILLIDDDPDNLLVCSLIFRRRGYEVKPLLGCEKMEDLVDAVEDFKPDLIFMDHNMPGICGTDATKMLKSHPQYRDIPVIYFTDEDNIEQLAREAGADAHLRKPFEFDALIKMTNKFIAN